MSYTISDLIKDVLPRVTQPEQGKPSGISIWVAANAIRSLVYKNLLDRKSDLLATGELFLVIPEYDYLCALPSGFINMAEKPCAFSAPGWLTDTPWMAGKVTSYTAATKTLVVDVTASNGSGTVAAWSIAIGFRPGYPINKMDTSESSVLVGTGSKTFVTDTTLALVPGQNIVISNVDLPTDSIPWSRLDPSYLDDDDHDDYLWWEEYKLYGQTFETASSRPRKFKVLGSTFYVRPKVITPIIIAGKYNEIPTPFVEGTYTTAIPWSGLFDELFREGSVWIILKGVAMPDADPAFMTFFNSQFGKVINAKASMLPETQRTRRGNFM